MQTKGEQCGLVERLLEPDSHDPACPFPSHCYCDDGAPHDHVSHPLASEAAGVITELLEALRPFADACNITTAGDNDDIDDTLAARNLTWGDLRRASAAIAKAKGPPLMTSAEQQRVEEIAGKLNADERAFLAKVCDGLKLGLADRKEDRARQKCRRLGLVHVLSKPRRWGALPLGIAVRTHLQEQAS